MQRFGKSFHMLEISHFLCVNMFVQMCLTALFSLCLLLFLLGAFLPSIHLLSCADCNQHPRYIMHICNAA